MINGYSLRMPKGDEPEALVYIQEIDDPKQYEEIIFCGYGEPTIRWDVVKKVLQNMLRIWVGKQGLIPMATVTL